MVTGSLLLIIIAIALILILVMACTALSGCGKGGDSGKKASADGGYDLVFWTYSDMVLNDQGKLMDQWVKEFVEENDDVNSITVVAKAEFPQSYIAQAS